jgi:hypothetical protein
MGYYPTTAIAVCTPLQPAIACTACPLNLLPLNGIPTSNTDPSCPFACPPGYSPSHVDNGKRAVCEPHWAFQQALLQQQLLTSSSPIVVSTPVPHGVVVVNDRPHRRVRSRAPDRPMPPADACCLIVLALSLFVVRLPN